MNRQKLFPESVLPLILYCTCLTTCSATALAQVAGDLEMEKFQFSGMVNADNVYVRSGSSESDYPVMKLAKGDTVVVVGQKIDWLKILPPEGSFCLISRAWVDRRSDGKVGRISEGSTNAQVRIGSSLNNMLQKFAVRLKPGDDVTIIGEQEDYFKIVPPAGTVMFVHKKFIDPLKRVEVVSNNGQIEVKNLDQRTASESTAETVGPDVSTATGNGTTGSAGSGAGSTGSTGGSGSESALATSAGLGTPGGSGESSPAGDKPRLTPETPEIATASGSTGSTTQPSGDASDGAAESKNSGATAEFAALEKRLVDMSLEPIEQQPIDEVLTGYKKLFKSNPPDNIRPIVEARIKVLEVRKQWLADQSDVKKLREQFAAERQPLDAESHEIDQRLSEVRVKRFDAAGLLRASAITDAGRPLYRLTDPANGHTVVYLRTNDPALLANIGTFIAVTGQVSDDEARRIKLLSPQSFEAVDPSAVSSGKVISTLLPPSLVPGLMPTANAGG